MREHVLSPSHPPYTPCCCFFFPADPFLRRLHDLNAWGRITNSHTCVQRSPLRNGTVIVICGVTAIYRLTLQEI